MSDFGQTTRRLCSFGITALRVAAVAVGSNMHFLFSPLFQKTSIGLENSKKTNCTSSLLKLRFISIASERVVAGGDDTGHWRALG